MKFLMINIVCGIRSTGRICTDIAMALEDLGHDVKIAYGRENVPKQFQKYAIKIGSNLTVKIHGVKARLLDGAGFGSKIATKRFIKWIKKYDPDVIHLHNIHGYYLNVKILFEYLRTCGKIVIWTLHDCWAFTGHTAYCDAINCKRWKDGCYCCPQIREYPKSMIDRSRHNWKVKNEIFTGIPNLTIVTPSKWLADLVQESFLKCYPVTVIHNGVDTSAFQILKTNFKENYNIKDKKMILGVATTWDENKGYSDYLKLANLLGKEYQVVLVGVSNEQKLNLPSNIIGIERTNSVKELSQIYNAADFFVNLSKVENYPTVNLEAMCCGTPVITYDVGGSKESVELSGGIVVNKGDLHAVADAIIRNTAKCIITESIQFDKSTTTKKYVQVVQNRISEFKRS